MLLTLGAVSAHPQSDSLRKALSLIKAERQLEALVTLKTIGNRDPDFVPARTLLGFLLLQRASLADAERAFREVLQRDAACSAAQFGLGIVLMRGGLAQEATPLLEKAAEDPALSVRAREQWLRSLFLAGKEEEAFRRAKDLADRFPLAAEYHSILGFLYQTRNRTSQALAEYRRAVELDPKPLSNYFSLIALHRLERNWPAALEWTLQALVLDDNHPLLYQELARAYEQIGDSQRAETARLEARRCYEAEVQYAQAARAAHTGREAEAEKLLRGAVRTNPRLSKAWSDLGELLRRSGRLSEAYDAFLTALETDPENLGAHLGQAAVLRSQGRESEALDVYRRAVGWGLGGADLLAGMAGTYLYQGKAQEAAEVMLQAIRELPDDPDLLSYLGYLQEAAGRNLEALDSYSQALRLNAAQADALLGRANYLLQRGDTKRALEDFATITRLSPQDTAAWHGLIEGHRRSGNAAAAFSACVACLDRNPEDAQCREQLASLDLGFSRYGDAAAQFQFLLRKGTSSKSILDGLAFSLLNQGNYSGAFRVFESSLRRFGPDAWVESNLGYLSRCLGDLAAAAQHYRRACELVPSDPEKRYDLALVLYLKGDFASAANSLETALRLKPGWGAAHYNLAMAYWNLRQYAPALAHARLAQQNGVSEARSVVETLSARVANGMPKSASAYHFKQ
jgi:tetratricopeptide (TPR) repeat protein